MAEESIIQEALETFAYCEARERDNRLQFIADMEFAKEGKQWSDEVLRERKGRPSLTVNKLLPVIRQVVNDARQNKPSISVRPFDNKADKETADILGGLIRNIESSSNADIAYDRAIENAVAGGFGYIRVALDYSYDDTFDQDIVIKDVPNPLAVYGDPDSLSADGSDWNVAFYCDTLTEDEFEKRYPGADMESFAGADYPNEWVDGENVTVAEYWTREATERKILLLPDGTVIGRKEYEAQIDLFQALGMTPVAERTVASHKVKQRIITGREVLEENDWAGCYIPIIPVYGDETVIKNKRLWRSLIYPARGAQERYNYWVSAMTEMAMLSPKVPYIGPEGAFDADPEKWSNINRGDIPYVEYSGPAMPQRQAGPQMQPAMMQEARAAADDIKSTTGIFDASLGQRSNETSGVAIRARQMEGDVSTFHFIDNLTRAIRQTGRVIVDLIPKVYTADRIIRVLGEDGKTEQVALGQPVQTKDGKERIYDLAVGKYDVSVKAGPSFTTQREETRAQLVDIIRAFPDAARVLGPMYLRQSDWPGAEEAADILEGKQPEGGNGVPTQVQAQVQQMQQMLQQGAQRLAQLEQENAALKANRELEQQKIMVDAEKVQVDRMKAQTDMVRAQAEIAKAAMPAISPYGIEQANPPTL